MEDTFDILDSLSKRPKPQVPSGFFDEFSSSVLNSIEDKKENIVGLEKNKATAVPAGFFENFSADLMSKIKESEVAVIEHPAKRSTISLKIIGFASAVAACMLLFFILKPNTNSEVAVIDENSTEIDADTEVSTIADEDYLAYLDESDLVDFLIENEDIELEEELSSGEESILYLFDEEIEDIYLEEL